jgi:hypothetical protein
MLVECFLRVKGRMVMIDVMRMLCVLSISCRGSMHRCGLIPAPSCEVGGRPSSDAVAVAAAVVATLVAATEITFWGWIRTDPLTRPSSTSHIPHSSFLLRLIVSSLATCTQHPPYRYRIMVSPLAPASSSSSSSQLPETVVIGVLGGCDPCGRRRCRLSNSCGASLTIRQRFRGLSSSISTISSGEPSSDINLYPSMQPKSQCGHSVHLLDLSTQSP